MKRLCTICARGGSKGVKGKNLRLLQRKPLLAHSIAQARESGLFDLVAVGSDSDDILAAAIAWGADHAIKRPAELATDQAAKIPAIRHCVLEVERLHGTHFDTLIDLDATSPLRSVDDIRSAVIQLETSGGANLITAMPSRRSPYFNLVEQDAEGRVTLSKPLPNAVVRRQDAPKTYDMNASIYVWQRQALFDHDTVFIATTQLYVMPEERSIDIDSELDFEFVEFLMSRAAAGKP